jgi:hypothetical protein
VTTAIRIGPRGPGAFVGSAFRHVADGAMYPCGGDYCHHCERDDVPIYRFDGEIVNPLHAKNPALASE